MTSQPWILGISASHNGAVCLLHGDEIVVAIQEERLSRIKRDRNYGAYTSLALEYCFDYAKILPGDLSMVVLCVQGRTSAPNQDLTRNPYLQILSNNIPVLKISHHFGHAVSAFATSGFKDAAVLVIDGVGSPVEDMSEDERSVIVEDVADGWETISLYAASDTSIRALEKHLVERYRWIIPNRGGMFGFQSLGGMFSAVSRQMFGDINEAGKVMGLAPYGLPEISADQFLKIVNRQIVFQDKVPARFAHNDRWPSHETAYENLACSTQLALEEALLYLTSHIRDLYRSENLCYAGGVALNSVANERIIRESGFKDVFIMPAAEDSGPAIGAAYYGLWELTKTNTRRRLMHDAVGREYSSSAIANAIERAPSIESIDSDDVISDTVELLCAGKIVGWFQGRSELGPRALGQRSILCDPRRPDAKEVLNSRVKHREPFRPFAPVVLLEEAANWFELDGVDAASPFMLRIAPFRKNKMEQVPAVAHVDGTGRLQSVTRQANGRFYDLIKKFYEKTGVPIILNTSFNVMGEPIIETPEDALACLLSTGIDYCVLEDRLVTKKDDFRSEALGVMLDRIKQIKKGAGEHETDEAVHGIIERIHDVIIEAISAHEKEVIRHLGCSTPDLDSGNFEKILARTLFERTWQYLEEGTRTHLIRGRQVYQLLTKYPGRNKDWTAMSIEFIEALQLELQEKLIKPFAEWAKLEKGVDLGSISSQTDAGSSGNEAGNYRIPLYRISGLLNTLNVSQPPGEDKNRHPNREAFSSLLRDFATSFHDDAAIEFLGELQKRLTFVVSALGSSLQAEVLPRDVVTEFTDELIGLIQRLCHFAEALKSHGSA
ncbi:MAG: carbamoyltransferase C-terminal domain-containing protein [Blastocatellia bacterium]